MTTNDPIPEDRIGVGATIGIVGAASGGSLIGTALVGFGVLPAETPVLSAVAGVVVILAATVLAGWYLPNWTPAERDLLDAGGDSE